jgi:DNA polymerase I-like protein with 3'-5' exonuclease and polymerase domains
MYLDIELEGMYINWDRVREVGKELRSEISKAEARLLETFPGIDIHSPRSIGAYIENKLGWENLGRGKDKLYLTNKKVMQQWKKLGHKEVSLFLDLSELKGLYQTFIGDEAENTGIWQHRYLDNRIHGTFWVMLAKSHRNRSSEPNLQNIPKNGKKAILIRSIFSVPSDEYYIVETDGAGLQLRIGASHSNDSVMRNIFINEDGDLHSTTAFRTFVKADDYKIKVQDEETGTTWVFFNHEEIKVRREDVEIVIEAGELLETDVIVDN